MASRVVSPQIARLRDSRRVARSPHRWTRVPACRASKKVFSFSDDSTSERINLTLVTRVPNAHGGAVLALAAVEDPDPDSHFPSFVSTSIDGTIATWHVEEDGDVEVSDECKSPGASPKNKQYKLVRSSQFGDDDAPWWCLQVDDDWMYYGTHTRKVRVRLAVDSELEKLPGCIENHTGWVRAMAKVKKTQNELSEGNDTSNDSPNGTPPPPTTGDTWRFSAACNVVRVWQDSFGFDEDDLVETDESYEDDDDDDSNTSAIIDVNTTSIFTGDILCMTGVEVSCDTQNERFLLVGVTDGTVRGWHVDENVRGKKHTAPVMRPILRECSPSADTESAHPDTSPGSFVEDVAVDLGCGRVTDLHVLGENNEYKVVAGCRDGTIGLVDVRDLSTSPRVTAHAKPNKNAKLKGVAALCAGPNNTVCSIGDDGNVKLWKVVEGSSDGQSVLVECGGVSDKNINNVASRSSCAIVKHDEVIGVAVGDEAGGIALYVVNTSS